jgi:hypothetical protein
MIADVRFGVRSTPENRHQTVQMGCLPGPTADISSMAGATTARQSCELSALAVLRLIPNSNLFAVSLLEAARDQSATRKYELGFPPLASTPKTPNFESKS